MNTIDIDLIPGWYREYQWSNVNHALRGYPGDSYPEFCWIKSLEDRGLDLVEKKDLKVAPIDYLREILLWGAGAQSPSQKFEAGLGSVTLIEVLQDVVSNVDDPRRAITAALRVPGFGLTYASKLLRFLNPTVHASLDSRIREMLTKPGALEVIKDYNNASIIEGYVKFQSMCVDLCERLESAGHKRPDCKLMPGTRSTAWRAADVEMALFVWASKRKRRSASDRNVL